MFDGTIADMLSNKKLEQVVTELFICGICFYHTTILCSSKIC